MIIDKNLIKFSIFAEDSIRSALKKIEENKAKTIFVVDENSKLLGVLTDGDLRRWLLDDSISSHDLNQSVLTIINPDFFFLNILESPETIMESLNSKISTIPLLNEAGILKAVVLSQSEELSMEGISLSETSAAFIIAEIGNNHNGDIRLAKKLVDEAKRAGADCAKFQLRNLHTLYRNAGDSNDAEEDLGSQYTLNLLNKYQLSEAELFEVFDYCRSIDIIPLCTPWDVESFEVLENYGMSAYKVASADFTNHDLIKVIAKAGKPMICSTGMSSENEIHRSVKLLREIGAQFVLLHCNSTYPTPFKDINLKYMLKLKTVGDCLVGYSGHERGYLVPIAAISMGAKVIEKHLTLDRTMEGNDHKVSLLPEEFKMMVEGIRQIEESLGNDNGNREMSQGELMNRETLGKSIIINCDLKKGELVSEKMLDIRSPGKGLAPYHKNELIGSIAKRDLKAGDFFYPTDINKASVKLKKKFRFSRPWGLPVRYHDYNLMLKASNIDLVEFHFSYKDLDININEYIEPNQKVDFVVHCPELFAGDHLLDLCSRDKNYRLKSISEFQRVIEITKQLKHFFPESNPRPLIVTNVGGFTNDEPLKISERTELYEIFEDSLSHFDLTSVEIIPQTMPPFPWLFGGQRYHNLFMSAEEMLEFCKKNQLRICLDISHSKLACNHFGWSFTEFVEKVSPIVAHMHVVDAKGVDGEGLQIGAGEIDFYGLSNLLKARNPTASFIPEIWQGHKNDGEDFWIGLSKLENVEF